MSDDPAFNRAIITSEFDEPEASCEDCGEAIGPNDVSVEEFEQTADTVCGTCADSRNERRVDAFWSGE